MLRSLVSLFCLFLIVGVVWADKPLKTEIPEEVLAGRPPDGLALLFPGL